MSEKTRVSVVTMTYKKYDNLFKTIKSVLEQDYQFVEYIIADDGSGNFPESDVRQYVEKHNSKSFSVKYIIREENVGTVRNLDDAYKNANGEILIPLSCGDEFLNKSVINEIVSEFKNKSCNVMAAARLACDQCGNPLYFLPHISERKKIEKLFSSDMAYDAFISGYSYDMASGCALYIRKKYYIDNGGFDKRFRLWEDGPFIEKSLRKKELTCLPSFVAIKYDLGGISNGKKPNPIMLNDIEMYNSVVRAPRVNSLSRKYKKVCNYSINRAKCKNRAEVCILYLTSIVSVMYRCLYLLGRKKAYKKDLVNINTVIYQDGEPKQ